MKPYNAASNEGTEAFRKEKQVTRERAVKEKYKAKLAPYQKQLIAFVIAVIFMGADFTFLRSAYDDVLLENVIVLTIISATTAILFDLSPLIYARLVQNYRIEPDRTMIPVMVIVPVAYFILFSFTVWLRFASLFDRTTGTAGILQFENTAAGVITSTAATAASTTAEISSSSLAVTALLAVMPLVTTVITFCLGMMSESSLVCEKKNLEFRRIQIEEAISELDPAIAALEQKNYSVLKETDDMLYAESLEKIKANVYGLMQRARGLLCEHLGNPQATSLICDTEETLSIELLLNSIVEKSELSSCEQ